MFLHLEVNYALGNHCYPAGPVDGGSDRRHRRWTNQGDKELSEIIEERTVVADVPVGTHPVVETHRVVETRPVAETHRVVETRPAVETRHVVERHDSVIDERRGMSGVAVAALVVAGITAAVLITVMILNSQQRTSDQAMAQERAKNLAAQQPTPQTTQQQPIVVNMPPSQQPTMVPYPVTTPAQPAAVEAKAAPSNADVEADIQSKLLNDDSLRSYAIDVKVKSGTCLLSGSVTTEDLKSRAEKLAMSATGVLKVINDLTVRS